jgi:hypothetical protein
MNLLKETLEVLSDNNKTQTDVLFVTDGKRFSSWKNFIKYADFDYDNGYGGNEISLHLKIVGHNWWLERGEYDGSEWWEFKTLPFKPKEETELKLNIRED